jgi:malonate-semialdehyde dehydrogenase (acetylating)/methylmalonate-semialdehyde dehydrogenase
MNRLLVLMQENKEAMAKAITIEHGKVFSDAMGEVERGIDIV